MTTRGQVLRSSITGNVPATNSRWPGEIWSNFPDKQIGVIDASKVAQPLVGVRFFSTTANYVAGDFVVQGGGIYRAKVAVTASAFNATQWAQVGGSVLVSDTPPGGSNPGDLWFDSVGGQLFVYYNDGNTSQWVVASNQNVGGLFLPLTGGALSGALTINNAVAGTASLQVNAPNGPANITLNSSQGQFRNIVGQTSGSLRWTMALGDNSAESGSNAGSNFTLTSLSDDLSTISTPFSISRAATYVYLNGKGAAPIVETPSGGHATLRMNKAPGATLNNISSFTNGKSRWDLTLGDTNAESGSDVGSNFVITRYNDAGMSIDSPLLINRANGTVSVNGAFYCGSGNIASMARGSGNAQVGFLDNTGTSRGYCYWEPVGGGIRLVHLASSSTLVLDGNGVTSTTTTRSKGAAGLQGTGGGSYGSIHNWFWSGGIQAWVDTTNTGVITVTSDYRTKKDIEELPSMWETLKALRPIKYTQAEFSPPSHVEFIAQEKVKAREAAEADPEATPREVNEAPMFEADDDERWGFLAHELQETLVPSASSGVKDSPDTIQSPNPWTVIATLTKALQEAITRIEALEAGAGA